MIPFGGKKSVLVLRKKFKNNSHIAFLYVVEHFLSFGEIQDRRSYVLLGQLNCKQRSSLCAIFICNLTFETK
jgi:hypothetical protein